MPVSIMILVVSGSFSSSASTTSLLLTSGCSTFWIKIGRSNIPVSIITLEVSGTSSSSISTISGLAKSHHKPVSALVSGASSSTFWIKIGRSKIPVSIMILVVSGSFFSSVPTTSLSLTSGCSTFWIKIGRSNIPVSIITLEVSGTFFSSTSTTSGLVKSHHKPVSALVSGACCSVFWIMFGRSKMLASIIIGLSISSSFNSLITSFSIISDSWINIGRSKMPVSMTILACSSKVSSSDNSSL